MSEEKSVPEEFASTFQTVDPYPYEETHDLRSGPELHDDLLPLLPLVGLWRGRGQGGYPDVEDFMYAQEIEFFHDGRPFLQYRARSWLLDAEGKAVRPANKETGFWRVSYGENGNPEVEAMIAQPTGILELFYGQAKGTTQWEVATDAVVRSPHSKEVTAEKRLYGVVEGALMYAVEMAAQGHPLTPHLSARLNRVGG
ncbi:FABP family protein [Salininema proteolyticum]|uniref:Peroxynitrite isomerase n=1 Tax=Salininema proteolyticum TaxID=1607685 RepID=A0ABV8TW13_9ACTN